MDNLSNTTGAAPFLGLDERTMSVTASPDPATTIAGSDDARAPGESEHVTLAAPVRGAPPRPQALPVIAEGIPDALRDRAQWVLWKFTWSGEKWTKKPHQADGRAASSTDPSTWCDFSRAMNAFSAGGFDGVGFVVTADDDFVGIDLDHAVHATGEPKAAAAQLMHKLASYAERTPSGEGFRVWLRGRKPTRSCKKTDFDRAGTDIEIYESGRFFTVTGQRISAEGVGVEPLQSGLDALCAQLWLQTAPEASQAARPLEYDVADDWGDDRLLARARDAKNGEKFRRLFDEGDTSGHGGDDSAADLALCSMLAFWTAREPERMDRMFRRSRLMRDKWDEYRGVHTYGQITIAKAIENCREVFGGGAVRRGWSFEVSDEASGPDFTHDTVALALGVAGWNENARYVPQWGKWVFWNGLQWRVDDKLEHMSQIRAFLRGLADDINRWAISKEAALGAGSKDAERVRSWAARQADAIRQAPFRNYVEVTARSNPGAVAAPDQFDANPDMLGTPAGVIDLTTGEMVGSARDLLITKSTAVSPAPKGTSAPLWAEFLKRIFNGDMELIGFLQRAAGYALTGYTREHKLLFLHGVGSNGKSVFLNTLFGIVGEYGRRAPASTFIDGRGEHPTDLAGLQGARMVVASELPEGRAWNESVLKDLTGGDVITARYMRQDFFDFTPHFTLFLVGNHLPSFNSAGEAMRRRMLLVPFAVSIPPEERNAMLAEELSAEWPAILRWCIDGAAAWYRMGLNPPACVVGASAEYLNSEDTLGRFLAEACEEMPGVSVAMSAAYAHFTRWATAGGEREAWTQHRLTRALKERGLAIVHKRDGNHLVGFRIRDGFEDMDGQPPAAA